MAAYYAKRVHFSGELFTLHLGGRLFQQYIIDVVAKTKQNTFNLLVLNQAQLRAKLYQGLANMVKHDFQLDPTQVGQQIILRASFRRSPCFMMQMYQDGWLLCEAKEFGMSSSHSLATRIGRKSSQSLSPTKQPLIVQIWSPPHISNEGESLS
jgi:hypothetical protein